jgi:hypothetical protein
MASCTARFERHADLCDGDEPFTLEQPAELAGQQDDALGHRSGVGLRLVRGHLRQLEHRQQAFEDARLRAVALQGRVARHARLQVVVVGAGACDQGAQFGQLRVAGVRGLLPLIRL